MPKHLLNLSSLSTQEINGIIIEAQKFRDGASFDFSGKIACNLFFESSTRTQYSFNVAEEKLGMRVVSFNPAASSLNKQESFYDTVMTFNSFRPDVLVIRHSQNEYYNELLGHVDCAILNGGDGTGNHPTQSLLDLMTIKQEFGGFEGKKCAIVGDIKHSRVAHTNLDVMKRLGMEVCISGPEQFREDSYLFEEFDRLIETCDVIMLLRVQHERHGESGGFDKGEYHAGYGLTAERVRRMKPGAIIMHPAPFNRGVEIADEVVECERSRIFKQMENGVFIRMAAIKRALEV